MAKATDKNEDAIWETVHRVVFPIDTDSTVVPLYVSKDSVLAAKSERSLNGRDFVAESDVVPKRTDRSGESVQSDKLAEPIIFENSSRRSISLPNGVRFSFATFFNGFPAGYWQQWTGVDVVRLRIETVGKVDIDVFRSTARGSFNRIESASAASGLRTFDLGLTTFGDGGWLWFELVGAVDNSRLISAEWQVDKKFRRTQASTKFTAAITTYNRPDDCVIQMNRFANEPSLLERLDTLLITDQGTKHVKDASGFKEAEDQLGNQFALVEQGNLGGSGGFARGMHEGSRRAATDYVMLLDDDILIEPEAILRAVNFADYTTKPTLVGGHMLNLYERSKVQNFGEYVNEYPFRYAPVNPDLVDFDFARHDLRATPALHRRIDVGYNGWWMCLIPVEVIKTVGLSLPVFIKWDDVEYGLRAARAGYHTVTLPGAGVWHMPFVEKDDRLDWQAYFHQRNRWLAALLYSPYKGGGVMPAESFAADVKHLYSQQYSAVALRILALEDLLSGPAHLHQLLAQRAVDVRKIRLDYSDARVIKSAPEFPEVRRSRPLVHGRRPSAPRNRVQWVAKAAKAMIHNSLSNPVPEAREHPEARIAAIDANWWNISANDSSLVTTSDGTGVSWYIRDKKTFRALLKKSLKLHRQLKRDWNKLAAEYRQASSDFTSESQWSKTFSGAN